MDDCRKERVVYDKIYRDLEYEYKQSKIDFMKCLREQKGVLQQRDLTLEQLQQLKDEASKLERMFEDEWQQILTHLSQGVNLE